MADEVNEAEFAAPISWRIGAVAARPVMAPADLERAAVRERAQRRDHVLVQFDKALPIGAKSALAQHGVDLLTPLDGNAWFARLNERPLDVAAMTGVARLLRLERIEPVWKVHPELSANNAPRWAIVSKSQANDAVVALYVLLHRDVEQDAGAEAMTALGGAVVERLKTINGLVITLPASALWRAAALDQVQWIEPAMPAMQGQNDLARASIGADTLQDAPFGLDGGSVRVMLYDAGRADASHPDLAGRVTTRDESITTQHATHVAGIIGGTGLQSGGVFRGMAPGVMIESYGYEPNADGVELYDNPGDMERDYENALLEVGVDLANNSIGSNIQALGLPCEFEGDYSLVSAVVDSIAYGTLGRAVPMMWAAGNERIFPANCGQGWRTIPPPATAKNSIVIGAIYSDFDVITPFSSYGPTDDGRIKPDIVAPGCEAGGDNGLTSTNIGGGYIALCGTSMATPTVTGVVSLMLQDFRANAVAGTPDPSAARIKAVLVQTAQDLWHPGPDYRHGFGMVRAAEAVEHLRAGNCVEAAIGQGETWEAPIVVVPGTAELTATVAWLDPPNAPNVTNALVNDLDVMLVGPDGEFFPWTLNPNAPGQDAVRTQPDHRNNIEQVTVDNPTPGIWQIYVTGFNVPEGPQSFAVATGSTIVRLELTLPGGALNELPAGETAQFLVNVNAIGQALLAQSLRVHYRVQGESAFVSQPLRAQGGSAYAARLPATMCGKRMEFYLSASGSISGQMFDPPLGPLDPYVARVVESESFVDVEDQLVFGGIGDTPPPAGDGTAPDPFESVDLDGQIDRMHRCLNPIPVGDLDGNHIVDGIDLANLLYYWNTTEISADLDASWNVDGEDLSILLYNWTD